MKDSVSDLVGRAARGDRNAREVLLEKHLHPLRAFVRLRLGRLIRSKESSADIVQSVCAEAVDRLDRQLYSDEVVFRNWLFRRAERKILDRGRYYRRERRDAAREVQAGSLSESDWDPALLECYRTLFTGSRHALAREELARVEEAFDQLRPRDREIITLSRLAGLSHQEIADRLGQSNEAIRARLCRALARLTTLLDAE